MFLCLLPKKSNDGWQSVTAGEGAGLGKIDVYFGTSKNGVEIFLTIFSPQLLLLKMLITITVAPEIMEVLDQTKWNFLICALEKWHLKIKKCGRQFLVQVMNVPTLDGNADLSVVNVMFLQTSYSTFLCFCFFFLLFSIVPPFLKPSSWCCIHVYFSIKIFKCNSGHIWPH